MNEITRRQAMKVAVTAGAGAVLAATGASAVLARATTPSASRGAPKIRVGFAGVGDRGADLLRAARRSSQIELAAVCDTGAMHGYHRLLARTDIDAVVIAAPPELQAEMTLAALEVNKFVGAAAAPACATVDQCEALVRAHHRHAARFMLLDSHLYDPRVTLVQRMAERGAFGDLTYACGALAAACRWMGVDGVSDRLQTLVAMDAKSPGTFARDESLADRGAPKLTLIRTARGRLIELRHESVPRPGGGAAHHSLQGTRGAYDAARGTPHVYIEGRSPADQWEPLENYASEFQHAAAPDAGQADGSGRDGGDAVMLADFAGAVRTGRSPVDLIDAATWASVAALAAESIRAGSRPLEVPNFRQG